MIWYRWQGTSIKMLWSYDHNTRRRKERIVIIYPTFVVGFIGVGHKTNKNTVEKLSSNKYCTVLGILYCYLLECRPYHHHPYHPRCWFINTIIALVATFDIGQHPAARSSSSSWRCCVSGMIPPPPLLPLHRHQFLFALRRIRLELWVVVLRRWEPIRILVSAEMDVKRLNTSTIQYNTIQYNTIQYNIIQYNTIQYHIEYDIE